MILDTKKPRLCGVGLCKFLFGNYETNAREGFCIIISIILEKLFIFI